MTFGMTLGFTQRFLLPPVAGSVRRSSPSSRFSSSPTLPTGGETMENGGTAASRIPASNPKLSKVQSLLNDDSQGGWEKCWGEGITPWDLGNPTPVILHLVETGDLPSGKALVPGCGRRTSESPNKEYFTFLAQDFFTWQTTEQFDLIFDYTFFCALDLSMRSAWADRIGNLLKPDGELITLMYPVDQYDGGPPFAVSVNDYEEVLGPLGFKAVSVVDNELAIEPRKGREKLGRWKRNLPQALM